MSPNDVTPLVTLADRATVLSRLESLLAVHSTDGLVSAVHRDGRLDGHRHDAVARVAPVSAHLESRLAVHPAGGGGAASSRRARAALAHVAAEGVLLEPVRAVSAAAAHRGAVGLYGELRWGVARPAASRDVGGELGGGVSGSGRGQLRRRRRDVGRELRRGARDVGRELRRGARDVGRELRRGAWDV